MTLLLSALAVLLLGAAAALLLGGAGKMVSRLGASAVVLAAVLGSIPAIHVLAGGMPIQLRFPWPVPYGEFFIRLDALSAWFLLPTLLLSALCAIYGVGYLQPTPVIRSSTAASPSGEETERGASNAGQSLGPIWFFYQLLVLGMALVLVAYNAVLFLSAWELMAVSSFFLVTFEHRRPSVRDAGWIYLVATHLGTAFLLTFFILTGRETGSMNFDVWAENGIHTPGVAGILFLLAVVGFGTKAGFMPFHVWLPEAHPAAPSHVSALMSGVMIKTGIYGLLRAFTFLGTPPGWWGWVLVGIGLTSGVLGVLFALAQHDLKRLLAYSSVENIGIIALGIGVGLLGAHAGLPLLTALGFGSALLHVLNHSLFKGLLFLGAGAVAHSTGTREMDHLGGLLKKMPWTGMTFLIGAAAISGLPPLNGFVSEFLIFLGALRGAIATAGDIAVPLLALIAGLGLIGGLAVACFTKAFGIVFLGEPRVHRGEAHEVGWVMRWPMFALAAGCLFIGLFAPWVVQSLQTVLANVTGQSPETLAPHLTAAAASLTWAVVGSLAFWLLLAVLSWLRRGLLAGRRIETGATWDCGYARPTARMQYTSSSFAQPLTHLFGGLLGTRQHLQRPEGLFPATAALVTETPDLSHEELYRPAFLKLNEGIFKLRWMQRGHLQLYVLYIAATLAVLLAWKLR